MRIASVVAMVLMMGCGGGGPKGPDLHPVSGVVNFKGSPLPNATITFVPASGPVATGISDASGNFTLKTGGDAGAVVGDYKVAVIAVEGGGGATPEEGSEEYAKMMAGEKVEEKWLIPEKYGNATTSQLSQSVQAGDNQVTLDLTE